MKMKINISDLAGKVSKGVGFVAGIAVSLAITLTAVVHIKGCLKELKVHKKPRIKNVVIITDSCDSETPKDNDDAEQEVKE